MGFFSSLFSGQDINTDLVTFVVNKKNDEWESYSVEVETTSKGPSLDEVVEAGFQAALTKGGVKEVQFAIYPWGGDIDRVFMVNKAGGTYTLQDDNSMKAGEAASLEDLVANARVNISEPGKVMLQYARSI